MIATAQHASPHFHPCTAACFQALAVFCMTQSSAARYADLRTCTSTLALVRHVPPDLFVTSVMALIPKCHGAGVGIARASNDNSQMTIV